MPVNRCPLRLKSGNIGASPCPGSEFTLAQHFYNCPCSPCSLILGEFRCCAVGASLAIVSSHLPTLHLLSSLFLGDQKVPDFSGRRLAQDCQCLTPPLFFGLVGLFRLFPLFSFTVLEFVHCRSLFLFCVSARRHVPFPLLLFPGPSPPSFVLNWLFDSLFSSA